MARVRTTSAAPANRLGVPAPNDKPGLGTAAQLYLHRLGTRLTCLQHRTVLDEISSTVGSAGLQYRNLNAASTSEAGTGHDASRFQQLEGIRLLITRSPSYIAAARRAAGDERGACSSPLALAAPSCWVEGGVADTCLLRHSRQCRLISHLFSAVACVCRGGQRRDPRHEARGRQLLPVRQISRVTPYACR